MSNFKMKILGTGICLPDCLITSEELEKKLGFKYGVVEKASGVRKRYHATLETTSEMGARAAKKAMENAGIDEQQLDAIISVSGVPQQAIPSTAALIHRHLNLKGVLAFDINATCLSFLMGLHCMGNFINQGIYKHVLLVASDIASVGLNPKDPKTAFLFGDGSAAVVLGPSLSGGILNSHFETRSEYNEDCQCRGGGTLYSLKEGVSREELYFQMNGPRLFKAATPLLLKMIHQFEQQAEKGIDFYIPHQASPLALDLFQKKMKIPDSKFMNIVRDYGNMIATSIPFALHMAIQEEKIQRGDQVLLFGTAAGLTIGGVLIEY